MSTVIKVENLSKQYRLGVIGTGTLSHDLNRWWHRVRGKEDPYLKIGESNVRDKKGESDLVWALRDINFEVEQGEVLGIIGKNGAGKSTLLKILSKVTGPTTGRIMAKGRIASLLEVGTGFHPELTGRENIYLNGTILGMSKAEVRKKLDEIVDFAGVERYLDTPVKRYSSGMKVRLGFAVAAHLEPDILIVDEVLAVGDAEFQKKAIGKMQEVSREGGRTVLFVSHNMRSVKQLCSKAVILIEGVCSELLNVEKAIEKYLDDGNSLTLPVLRQFQNNQSTRAFVYGVRIVTDNHYAEFQSSHSLLFEIELWLSDDYNNIDLNFALFKGEVKVLMMFASLHGILNDGLTGLKKGNNKILFKLPQGLLNEGMYHINISVHLGYKDFLYAESELLKFRIINSSKIYDELKISKPGIINII